MAALDSQDLSDWIRFFEAEAEDRERDEEIAEQRARLRAWVNGG